MSAISVVLGVIFVSILLLSRWKRMSEKHSTATLLVAVITGWGVIVLQTIILPPPYSYNNWILVGVETLVTYSTLPLYFAYHSGRLPNLHFSFPKSSVKFFGRWGLILIYGFDAFGMISLGYGSFEYVRFPSANEAPPYGFMPIIDLLSIFELIVGLWCTWRLGGYLGAEIRELRMKKRAEDWLRSL